MITTNGKTEIVNLLNNIGTQFSYIAIGSDDTVPTTSDTALYSELARVLVSPEINANTITFSATFPAGIGAGTIKEAGIFNSGSGGVMLSRVLVTSVIKGALDTFIITWTETIN